MKRIILAFVLICCLGLTACSAASIGVIGGADGPTAIYVDEDKWGLTLYAEDVTNTGMVIKFKQFGGNPTGELNTGEWYELEKLEDDNWQIIHTNRLINIVWNSIAYKIKSNDITELKVEWEWLYGELPAGSYRLSKKVMDLRKPGDFDEKVYKVHFSID